MYAQRVSIWCHTAIVSKIFSIKSSFSWLSELTEIKYMISTLYLKLFGDLVVTLSFPQVTLPCCYFPATMSARGVSLYKVCNGGSAGYVTCSPYGCVCSTVFNCQVNSGGLSRFQGISIHV